LRAPSTNFFENLWSAKCAELGLTQRHFIVARKLPLDEFRDAGSVIRRNRASGVVRKEPLPERGIEIISISPLKILRNLLYGGNAICHGSDPVFIEFESTYRVG
jgi:hypothetical protein